MMEGAWLESPFLTALIHCLAKCMEHTVSNKCLVDKGKNDQMKYHLFFSFFSCIRLNNFHVINYILDLFKLKIGLTWFFMGFRSIDLS